MLILPVVVALLLGLVPLHIPGSNALRWHASTGCCRCTAAQPDRACMNWLKKSLGVGHTPIALEFEFRGEKNKVTTTALLAEGGYSFVYQARQSQPPHRQFAAKKVLAQDEETRGIAEMELQVLERLAGAPGVVGYFGSCCKVLPNTHREYWMLLEFCPNGSLIDLLYAKGKKPGEFERRPALPEARVLEVFESIVTG